MKNVAAAVLAFSAFFGIACSCCERWERVDEYTGLLKCGMSESDVRMLANRFEGTSVVQPGPSNHPDIVVHHGGTQVQMWFDAQNLVSYEIVWINSPMDVLEEGKKMLCDD